MYELALFAGAGGGMLGGVLLGWRTVCAVEFDSHCREVLLRRQQDGVFSLFPIWDDVRTFGRKDEESGPFVEEVGRLAAMEDLVVTAGFPCQPYSVAGKGAGELDERNLWPDTIRVIREVGPRFVFLENVPRLLCFDYFGQILGDLGEAGYDAEWDVISAAEVGAPHLRKRLWIFCWKKDLAYADGDEHMRNAGELGRETKAIHGERGEFAEESRCRGEKVGKMAHAEGVGRQESVEDDRGHDEERIRSHAVVGREVGSDSDADGKRESGREAAEVDGLGGDQGRKKSEVLQTFDWWAADPADADGKFSNVREDASDESAGHGSGSEKCVSRYDRWGIESGLGRVADGVADRVDRLRAVGNGQVPLVAAAAFVVLSRRAGFEFVD